MPRISRINLREQPRAGEPIDIREGTPVAFSRVFRRVLLVHGYNVSRRQAEHGFERFEELLNIHSSMLAADCCWVFWPGDAYVPGVRALAYPWRLRHARQSAPQLAEYLASCIDPDGRPAQLIVIGHSLGCRLILEALAQLQSEGRYDLRLTLVLMAAAVPITLVSAGGALDAGVRLSRDSFVMFSRHDWVLRRVFALGQRIGRDATDPPLEAVGEWGLPDPGVWTRRRELLYHNHGDYWSSGEVARVIAGWLGAPTARDVAVHPLARSNELTERVLPEARVPPPDRRFTDRRIA